MSKFPSKREKSGEKKEKRKNSNLREGGLRV